ncbi:MAG: hypothetical protein Q4G68_08080 [Planctomycetia bacterium]|nr:hypothetical protein [Planctomycetia bacterium]
MKRAIKLIPLLVFCLFILSGCSNGKIPFGGKVTFDDGEVVTSGQVSFTTDTYMASGIISPDGTYKLSSTGTNDGLPPGKYKVVVSGVQKTVGNDLASEKVISLIDKSYENAESTPLECEVSKSGERNFDISLKRNPGVK